MNRHQSEAIGSTLVNQCLRLYENVKENLCRPSKIFQEQYSYLAVNAHGILLKEDLNDGSHTTKGWQKMVAHSSKLRRLNYLKGITIAKKFFSLLITTIA